jgi:para-aminobenzoate synthetase component 1
LLRNDLSLVANKVRLKSFRVPTLINAGAKRIWQTSSEIIGTLDDNWQSVLGDIFAKLLPAGSISGTPKKMTVKILKEIEDYNRGFFTGVFGYFGGDFLDSAVAIRFIEQTPSGFFYKSGGGITEASNAKSEYEELLAKIYLPI